MAFKTLSPNAVWLLVQLRRAWRGTNERIELPFARVSWRLTFKAFDKARRELVEAGFVRIVEPGGLFKHPAVYALVEGWRGEVAKRLAGEPGAGYLKNVRAKDGRFVSVWYPAKKLSESQENAARARAAKARKKTAKKKPARKPRPRRGLTPDGELETAVLRLRRRMQGIVGALTEREGRTAQGKV
jgi:hypothetical protein